LSLKISTFCNFVVVGIFYWCIEDIGQHGTGNEVAGSSVVSCEIQTLNLYMRPRLLSYVHLYEIFVS